MRHDDKCRAFCKVIERWFLASKRHLPWRDLSDKNEAIRGYKVLVSEIMLQQTQVSRVIPIFRSFLKRFPTLESLARASNKEVLLAWRGMGYNGRALRLRDAAKHISLQYPSHSMGEGLGEGALKNFPLSMEELRKIPGIGPYTAAAIRNFAFNLSTPCIDTNIRRILHRTFYGPENVDGRWKMSDDRLLSLASKLLDIACDRMSAADWHAALMDYGSLVQTKRNPKWDACPLTAAGIMKATPKNFPHSQLSILNSKKEPGRMMAGRFVPDRIFRGRIVESLRDAAKGLRFSDIGKHICVDWSKEHEVWLQKLVEKLMREKYIMKKRDKYLLHH
jgi:A/G-specific adenine glycosylase